MLKVLNEDDNKKACATGCNAIPEGFIDVPETTSERIDERLDFMRKRLTNMGYRFVGNHSAIKVCHWTKESIRGKNYCYKKKFYSIESNQCVQMSPSMLFCTFNCKFCWRNFNYMLPRKNEQWDNPIDVINGCIEAQKGILQGFWGNDSADKLQLKEAMNPKHFAISLSGEPTLYPYLSQMIDELSRREITSYLVSNGTNPDVVEKLIDHQPTNLYISVYGTTPEMYQDTAIPMIKNTWEKVNKSLSLLKSFDCNTVMRLTLAKRLNCQDAKGYATLAEKHTPKFIEVKAFMAVGGSRNVMEYEDMPSHQDMLDFATTIESNSSYRIIDEKTDSRVVLLTRENANGFKAADI